MALSDRGEWKPEPGRVVRRKDTGARGLVERVRADRRGYDVLVQDEATSVSSWVASAQLDYDRGGV